MDKITFSIDPAAVVLGTIAVWLAWKAYTSSTHFILKVMSVRNSALISLEYTGPQLTIEFMNSGISIHNISCWLQFERDKNDEQSMGFSIAGCNLGSGAVLEKGMSTKFSIRPKEFEKAAEDCDRLESQLRGLKSPRAQQARFVVYSGDFPVVKIPLYSRLDRLKGYWNTIAGRTDRFISKWTSSDPSNPLLSFRQILPRFCVPSRELMRFIHDCKGLKQWIEIEQRNVASAAEASKKTRVRGQI